MDASSDILAKQLEETRKRKALYQQAIERAQAHQARLLKQRAQEEREFKEELASVGQFFYERAHEQEQWQQELDAAEVAEDTKVVKTKKVKPVTASVKTPAASKPRRKKKPIARTSTVAAARASPSVSRASRSKATTRVSSRR
jgi:hypothetical protein